MHTGGGKAASPKTPSSNANNDAKTSTGASNASPKTPSGAKNNATPKNNGSGNQEPKNDEPVGAATGKLFCKTKSH